jgi:hypothetical protein
MAFDFVPPEQFFELLYNDLEFCDGVGKVMLSASKLETNLRKYLRVKNIKCSPKSTLGNLVTKLIENNLLTQNGHVHFSDLALKRNYLAHSLYDLFVKEIEETILERDELTAPDTDIFIYRARQLAKDFLYFAEIVAKADIKANKLL